MFFKPITFFAVFLVVSHASAEGLSINPGLWETTTNQTNPFTGTKTETRQECVKETEFNPNSMMQGATGCTLEEQTISGDTLTFLMRCDQDGSKGTVSGRFQTDGQTGNGDMQMNMSFSGQSMQMEMNWTAKRLGDC